MGRETETWDRWIQQHGTKNTAGLVFRKEMCSLSLSLSVKHIVTNPMQCNGMPACSNLNGHAVISVVPNMAYLWGLLELSLCSSMIVCACGNNKVWENGQLNVNVFACNWMSKRPGDQMTVIVLHGFCTTWVENWVVLSWPWGIYIYCYTSRCQREKTRGRRHERKRRQDKRDWSKNKEFQRWRLFSALS